MDCQVVIFGGDVFILADSVYICLLDRELPYTVAIANGYLTNERIAEVKNMMTDKDF